MEISFEGQTALITGGTRGIGKAIAELLYNSGTNLIITGTKTTNNIKLPKKLNKISYLQVDFSSKISTDNFLNELAQIDNINICVNNAGINIINEMVNSTEEDYDKLMNVNLKSTYLVSKLLGKKMKKSGYGRIVNIASIWGAITKSGRGIYAATKCGLIGLTKTLAVELADKNVLVNAVSPGFTLTELTKSTNTEKDLKLIEKNIPMKRMADPIEIANVVGFLVSNKNTYITGQNIIVDGGYTIV